MERTQTPAGMPALPGMALRTLALGLMLALFLAALPADAAESDLIQLGKYRVHSSRLLARYAQRVTPSARTASLQSLGLTLLSQSEIVPGLVTVDLSGAGGIQKMGIGQGAQSPADALLASIQALEQTGLFEYVQPSYVYTNLVVPDDARFSDGTLWGLRNTGASGGTRGADIGAVQAWDLTIGSTNVIVAIVDTGIRYTHQDLATQMWHNPGEITGNGVDDDGDGVVDDVFGISPANGSGDPFDDNDHGTHLAGTIGAAANDGNPHVGVAWKVQLMACKFLAGDGFGSSDDAIAAIDFAVQHGSRVINASWGGGPFERALLDSITAARQRGVLFVAAAGNDFNDNDAAPFYPASYRLDNVIAVTAVDRQDHLANFANFGRTSVHLAAPGDGIFSCTAQSDSSYETHSGTSMAAPHVSGVAALIFSLFPNASIPEVRERLLSTAVKVPGLDGKVSTGGRVNAYRALSATPDGILELSFEPPAESDLSARRPVPFYVTVTDLVGVTNATVRAKILDTGSEVLLRNDGVTPDLKARDEVYSGELILPSAPGPFSVEFSISAPGKTPVTQTLNYVVAAPPVNDNFADALDIPAEGVSLQWTNRFASIELGEPKHARTPSASASVWWNWVPASSTPVIVDTAGSAFDTLLAIYTNNVFATLREVISADDAGSQKQGYVQFDARAGVAYHIAVAGFGPLEVGMLRLRVQPGGGPDTTAPVVTITGPASGLIVTNAADPKVLITGTALDPAPNITGVRQVQVQVNREVASTAIGTTNWSSTVLLQEGQNRIKVIATDYAGNASALRTVVVQYQPLISPNDLLTNAIALPGSSGAILGNNTRATKETHEPDHAGNPGGKSIWWTYRPAVSGLLALSTANSSFDTVLGIYASPSGQMADLEALGSNDDASPGSGFSQLTQPLQGGVTYYIAVDGANGSSGTVQLDYGFTRATVHVLKVDPSANGSAFPLNGLYAEGTTVLVTATATDFFDFDHWEGTFVSTDNPVSIVMSRDIEIVPRFRAVDFTDGFESGNLTALPWKTSGTLPWTVQGTVLQAGKFAARAGAIGSGQKSSLLLTQICRAGSAAFGVRVSSEAVWDTLDFYLNGQRLNRWSGEVPWTTFQFAMPAGTNTMEWRYTKDFLNTNVGLDTVFIDNVNLPLPIPVNSSTPARLQIQRTAAGGAQLIISGQTNQQYIIQSCGDLKAGWQSVSTNIASGGAIRWTDTPVRPAVYYRAIVLAN